MEDFSWSCGKCTFSNPNHEDCCAMCEAPNPVAPRNRTRSSIGYPRTFGSRDISDDNGTLLASNSKPKAKTKKTQRKKRVSVKREEEIKMVTEVTSKAAMDLVLVDLSFHDDSNDSSTDAHEDNDCTKSKAVSKVKVRAEAVATKIQKKQDQEQERENSDILQSDVESDAEAIDDESDDFEEPAPTASSRKRKVQAKNNVKIDSKTNATNLKSESVIEIADFENSQALLSGDFDVTHTSKAGSSTSSSSRNALAHMLGNSSGDMQEDDAPMYSLGISPSARAKCARCDEMIGKGVARCSVHPPKSIFPNWQHLDCTIFHPIVTVPESIDGFHGLKPEMKINVRTRLDASKIEWGRTQEEIDPDELVRREWTTEAEPPATLLMPLLPYQKEGLAWMMAQEDGVSKGGILADEMGMGKTIQTIALMLAHQAPPPAPLIQGSNNDEVTMCDSAAATTMCTDTKGGTDAPISAAAAKCTNCGYQHVVGARFCVFCGTAVEAKNTSTAPTQSPEPEPEPEPAPVSETETKTQSADTKHAALHAEWSASELSHARAAKGSVFMTELMRSSVDPTRASIGITPELAVRQYQVEQEAKTAKVASPVRVTLSSSSTSSSVSAMEVDEGKQLGSADNVSLGVSHIEVPAPTPTPKTKKTPAKKLLKMASSSSISPAIVKVEELEREAETSKYDTAIEETDAEKSSPLAKNKAKPASRKKAASTTKPPKKKSKKEMEQEFIDRPKVFVQTDSTFTNISARGGTLIILPTVAIRQWQAEIARFTAEGSMTVQVYHGSDRKSTVAALTSTDVVITSYKIVESEYRKANAGAKVSCRYCDRKFYAEKLRVHRHYFCGPDAKRTSAQSKTLKKKEVDADGEEEPDAMDDASASESDTETKATPTTSPGNGNGNTASLSFDDVELFLPKPEMEVDNTLTEALTKVRAGISSSGTGNQLPSLEEILERQQQDLQLQMDALENGANVPAVEKKAGKIIKTKTKTKTKTRTKKAVVNNPATKKEKTARKAGNESDSGSDFAVDLIDSDSEDELFDFKSTSFSLAGSEAQTGSLIATATVTASDAKLGKYYNAEVERDIAAATKASRKSHGICISRLHEVSWFRIVLDEAHNIKDRSTSTAKSVFQLISLYKWCLSGTPLQNRVSELYSQVRFLRFDPHAYYYCKSKGCHCKSLMYKFSTGVCACCGHSAMQHYCHFNKEILNPIKRFGYVDLGRKAMLKLKNDVLDEILMRRTKETRADDIQLPPRIVTVRSEKLDENEEDFYTAIYSQSQAQFSTYVSAGTVLNNYANIFEVLMRLRQAIDHPYLVIHSKTQHDVGLKALSASNVEKRRKEHAQQLQDELEETLCGLCKDVVEEPRRADCGHIFCCTCIQDFLDTVTSEENSMNAYMTAAAETNEKQKKKKQAKGTSKGKGKKAPKSVTQCPCCTEALSIDVTLPVDLDILDAQNATRPSSSSSSSSSAPASEYLSQPLALLDTKRRGGRRRKSILDKIDISKFRSSTKIEALMQELHAMQHKDLGAKAIVFSQFTSMLDIIEHRISTDRYSSGYDTAHSNANVSSVQAPPLKCAMLMGNMSIDQRDNIIKSFNTDPAVKVLLISLKAGGVALNLTVASHIFIMDPWWSPAAEMQAIDRTHRFGQHKPIHATRFIMAGTIEERILRLQEKKRLVFDATIGGDTSSMNRLTEDDMAFLFS